MKFEFPLFAEGLVGDDMFLEITHWLESKLVTVLHDVEYMDTVSTVYYIDGQGTFMLNHEINLGYQPTKELKFSFKSLTALEHEELENLLIQT